MLIETDIILAHIKEQDWLKPYAEKILEMAHKGKVKLYASIELIHELYYIARKSGIDIGVMLEKIVVLTKIENIIWIPTTIEIDLTAFTLIMEYDINSIFDAYHAATALLYDPDQTIISTDQIYDKVKGIKRIDPRKMVLE